MNKIILSLLFIGYVFTAYAQTEQRDSSVVADQNQHTVVNTVIEEQRIAGNDHQVITNIFKHNWFVLADAGVNAYWGDYTDKGSFSNRLTPQFNVGVGKWFVPGFGAKLQMTGFRSRSDKWSEGFYTHASDVYFDADGNQYWKERIKWFNFNIDLMFNLSRLIAGYEGIGSPKLKNQFIASIGLGVTHPYDFPRYPNNDFAGHVELQYSRFFSDKKNFSLDVRLRSILQSTQYDGVTDQFFDENYSVNVGCTYYFKERGWKRAVTNTTYYIEDQNNINMLRAEIDRLQKELDIALAKASAPAEKVVVNQMDADLITFPYLVNFVIDKVKVVNREKVNLKVIADMMKATPDQKYLICGYADKHTGTVARNIWLAENRAKNVYKILTEEFGVPESQLILDDKGGVENMFYDDPQLSRSAIITKYEE